ncbi:MAG: undecaprenyl-diphosphate phosphatase [Akkermansiaceae bacterium]|nr:undecaprenyl-diphosphate phosphatase [Akkermansiaceae bacterium]
MDWWQSLILGLIEGITEYLPVSSTGHLIVAQRMMGIGLGADKTVADCFAICIQFGAIAAVLGIFWPRVVQMIKGVFGQDAEGLKLLLAIFVGFLPAAIIGLIANDWIEAKLFHFKWVALAWFVGGIAILFADRWMKKGGGSKGRKLSEITIRMALIIGFFQCLAMWPGTSRSLATILGGLFVGLELAAAVEFSFLLGLLTLTAATVKKTIWPIKTPGLEAYHVKFGGAHLLWDTYGWMPLAVGCVVAAISAAIAVKWMIGYLNRKGLGVFGWYRIAISIVAVIMIATNFAGLNGA